MSDTYELVYSVELQLTRNMDPPPPKEEEAAPEDTKEVDSDAEKTELAVAVREATDSAGLVRRGLTPPGVGDEIDVTV